VKYTITTSPTSEDLYPFSTLKQPKESDYFIAESEKVVISLLASTLEIISLYLTEEHFQEKLPLLESHVQSSEATIIIAPKKEMELIVGFPLHQGIIASARIPAEKTIEELVAASDKPQLYIILDTVVDAENIGALYRTALAMGATAIIIDEKSISPWIRRAVRVSMGAVFALPTVTTKSLPSTIEYLNSQNILTLAAEIDDSSKPLWAVDLTQDIAIVFGSEGYGVGREVLDVCNYVIAIPMTDKVKSLNITVAQGMVLYEVTRQRNATRRT
jgi:TrmH family RNA methyltransferase